MPAIAGARRQLKTPRNPSEHACIYVYFDRPSLYHVGDFSKACGVDPLHHSMMQRGINWKMILFSTSFHFTFVLHFVSSLVLINKRKKSLGKQNKI